MTEISVSLTLLFFPGIICALLLEQFILTRGWSSFRFSLYAFVLGFGCYLLYTFLAALWQWRWPPDVSFLNVVLPKGDSNAIRNSLTEIVGATVLALPVAAIVAFVLNHKWLHDAADKIGVTKKFGGLDIWGFVFNSDVVPWITVRDLKYDLVYQGWVNLFSDTCDPNEIVLREVQVFRNSTGDKLYEVDIL